MLLGVWVRLFGDSEAATHTLSLVFGLACVPLAYFAARAVFGRPAGLAAAVLAALDPFLTYYAQETRMYELEALLSLVVAWSYVEGILRGRRAWTAVFVARDRAACVQPQLGPLPLRRPRRRHGRVRARRLTPVRDRGSRRRGALRAVAADAALTGAAHRRAVVDTSELSRPLPFRGHGDRRRRAVRRARARRRCGARRLRSARAHAGAAGDRRAAHRQRGHGRRRVRRVADLARVDGALLRGHLRPGRARRRPAIARARGLGIATLVALVFLFAGYSVKNDKENAQGDHRGHAAVPEDGRPDHLDPPRAGAGAALLPRPGLPLGDDARPGSPIR